MILLETRMGQHQGWLCWGIREVTPRRSDELRLKWAIPLRLVHRRWFFLLILGSRYTVHLILCPLSVSSQSFSMSKELVPTRTALLTRIRSEPQTNRNETNFTLLLYEATLIYTNRKIPELSSNLPIDLQVQIHSLIDFAPVVLDDQGLFQRASKLVPRLTSSSIWNIVLFFMAILGYIMVYPISGRTHLTA